MSVYRVIAISLPLDILKWVNEKASELDVSRSELIRRCIDLMIQVDEAMKRGVDINIEGYTPLHLDYKSYKLLGQIGEMLGETDMNKVLDYVIVSMHLMLKAGVWRLLKPLPQLADELDQKEEDNTS
jgi:metal-responsive CopG/Arc/MetJ family transcriptional regulator